MYSNVFRVTFNNINNTFKVLVYRIIIMSIIVALFVALVMPFVLPIIKEIENTKVVDNFVSIIQQIFSGEFVNESYIDAVENFNLSLANLREVLTNSAPKLFTAYLMVLLITVVGRFLYGLCHYAIGSLINENMSSFANYGFTSTLIKTAGKSAKLQLATMIVVFPVDVVIAFIAWLIITYGGTSLSLFMPMVAVGVTILLCTFRQTLFCMWLPDYVNQNSSVFRSLVDGVKRVMREFWTHYVNYLIILIVIITINVMCSIATLGAGLLFTAPLSGIILTAANFIHYYNANKLNYYTAYDNIVVQRSDTYAQANRTLSEEEIQQRIQELNRRNQQIAENSDQDALK